MGARDRIRVRVMRADRGSAARNARKEEGDEVLWVDWKKRVQSTMNRRAPISVVERCECASESDTW
jgi:hypothetical protein